jgi:hypothetical protein
MPTNCTVCRKRLTQQLEHESEVVLQRIALGKGLHPADVLQGLNPLCRLCRMIFQRACEADSDVIESHETESAEFEQISSRLKDVRRIRTA